MKKKENQLLNILMSLKQKIVRNKNKNKKAVKNSTKFSQNLSWS